MAITINGSTNAITGLAVGGLPDGSVDRDSIAADAIDGSKIEDDAVASEHVADDAVGVAQLSTTGSPGSGNFLRGDNSWQEAGGGKLIQTVFQQIKPTANIDGTGTSRLDSGLTVTITPTKANSRIWVNASGWTNHMNPGPAGLTSQSIQAHIEQNVASGGWTEPDGTAATSSEHVWNRQDWHDHDYDGRDDAGHISYIWSPSYTLGQAIAIRITYGDGAAAGGTKYFHHWGGCGDGAMLTMIASEIAT
tara:strand:+ start:198 stop:944 length:747 start_codon:yes stop_codon:yes gene_type:complete